MTFGHFFQQEMGQKKSLLQNRYVAGPGHPSHLYGRLEAVCGGGLAKFGVIWSNPLVLAAHRCEVCNATGHRGKDCWHSGKGGGKGDGKGKGKKPSL